MKSNVPVNTHLSSVPTSRLPDSQPPVGGLHPIAVSFRGSSMRCVYPGSTLTSRGCHGAGTVPRATSWRRWQRHSPTLLRETKPTAKNDPGLPKSVTTWLSKTTACVCLHNLQNNFKISAHCSSLSHSEHHLLTAVYGCRKAFASLPGPTWWPT